MSLLLHCHPKAGGNTRDLCYIGKKGSENENITVFVSFLLDVPVNNFLSCQDEATASWVLPVLLGSKLCLAQGHNTATL